MNIIFVYVEGYYDRIFVENVLADYFNRKEHVTLIPIEYSQKSAKEINKDIKSKSKHDYFLLTDLDSEQYPCIMSKKDKMQNVFTHLDRSKSYIVKEEIESWFLAGIDSTLDEFSEFNIPNNTDSVTKEEFNKMLEDKGISDKSAFLIDISKNFNLI